MAWGDIAASGNASCLTVKSLQGYRLSGRQGYCLAGHRHMGMCQAGWLCGRLNGGDRTTA